ncbi:hypothetical protein FQR65_LT18347 [Abscondita terminalis]|nr:hypothetical protein FQR65_LT18347 [Abscondita terminalis]
MSGITRRNRNGGYGRNQTGKENKMDIPVVGQNVLQHYGKLDHENGEKPGITLQVASACHPPIDDPKKSDQKGFFVKANETRIIGAQTTPDGAFLSLPISTTDTDEKLFIQTSTPNVFEHAGGPPPHIHEKETKLSISYREDLLYI